MKLVEILSLNPETGNYDHYTITTNKKTESLINNDNDPTDKFYNFIKENIECFKERPRQNIKCLVRDLSEYIKY